MYKNNSSLVFYYAFVGFMTTYIALGRHWRFRVRLLLVVCVMGLEPR